MSTELTPLETAFRAAFTNLACEFLAACNYRLPHHEYHAFNRRLDTIRSVLEHPADWACWWLAQSQEHIGVYRPQDHDPKQDSVSEVLNGVILHIAQTATRHLPDAGQIATHIKPKLGPKLRLSDVMPLPAPSSVWPND